MVHLRGLMVAKSYCNQLGTHFLMPSHVVQSRHAAVWFKIKKQRNNDNDSDDEGDTWIQYQDTALDSD